MAKKVSKEIWIGDKYTVQRDELNWIVTPYREKRAFIKDGDEGKLVAGTPSFVSSLESVINKLKEFYARDMFNEEAITNLDILAERSMIKLVADINKGVYGEKRSE